MTKIAPTGGSIDVAHQPVDLKSEKWDDDNALRICVQDTEYAQAWLESHYFHLRWFDADFHYQAPPSLKTWEGTNIPRANVSRYTVATHVNAINSQLVNGLFYEQPPFMLRGRAGTPANAVRAISEVQAAQLDQMHFREETENGLFNALLFGTGIWKWGWAAHTEIEKRFKRKDDPYKFDAFGKQVTVQTRRSQSFTVEEREKVISHPDFKSIDPRHVLVDPGCRRGDIREAKYVIHREDLTYRDLKKMKEEQELLGNIDTYDLPSEDEIRSWFLPPNALTEEVPGQEISETLAGSSAFLHHAEPRFQKTTEDPLDEPLEVLERYSKDRVVTVINRVRVIRNEDNRYHCLPFLSVNWWNIPDAFWGMGLGFVLAGEQRIQQGITNAGLDLVSLILNPQFLRSRGANVSTQAIRQRLGGIIDVDGDPQKAFMLQEVPTIPPEVFEQVQQSEARSESTSGANELLTMGNMPSKGRTSIGRTATGASALSQAAQSRIGKFVEDFVLKVYEPWLRRMHDLNCELLPVEAMREIVGERLGEEFEFDEEDYFNAGISRFDVLAGSHLAVKQQMAQAVTLMSQLFDSPQMISELAQINNEYVDVGELLHMISDMSGFKNYYSIVKPMTDEMKQRMQQNNPAVIQAKSKMQMQQQQQQGAGELEDQKAINRAVQLGLRQVLQKSFEQEAVTGEPGGPGFGSNENG